MSNVEEVVEQAKNTLTLDGLREKADSRWGEFVFDIEPGKTFRAANLLRLSKDRRAEVTTLLNGEQEMDSFDLIIAVFEKVTLTPRLVPSLRKALDGDLGMATVLFEEYTQVTEVGEASGSDD